MPGPRPRDPSGAARPVTVHLSPATLDALDRLRTLHLSSRSAVVAALIEREAVPGAAGRLGAAAPQIVAEGATRAPTRRKGRLTVAATAASPECRHARAVTRGRGPVMECPDCGARGVNLRSR